WNARNHTFDGLAAMYFENMTDTTGALPERVAAMRTSPRFFAVLGVAPALGRTPTPEEERFGGPPVAVVSDAFWRDRLNGDPSAAGRRLILGAVALVLLAACGNVACLMLADAVRREQEIAIRFALGAHRRTLVGQLLVEGVVLAVIGAAAGLLIAYWGIAALRAAVAELPR